MALWFIVLFASLKVTQVRYLFIYLLLEVLTCFITQGYGARLSERQTGICDPICTPVQNVNPTDFTALSCTNCLIQQLAACLDCDDGVTEDPQDAQDSQATISTFVSGCNAAGFSVHDVTVNGSFAASGGLNGSNSSSPTVLLQTNPYSCAATPTATPGTSSSSSGQKKANGSKGTTAGREMLFTGVLGAFLV
ncbi:hypothetical protein C8R44DRAFT_890216 [Mycena epipterygia]|nr:hypothetical protein C8R44DRAFT_890216 [Mycena epipterygia]